MREQLIAMHACYVHVHIAAAALRWPRRLRFYTLLSFSQQKAEFRS